MRHEAGSNFFFRRYCLEPPALEPQSVSISHIHSLFHCSFHGFASGGAGPSRGSADSKSRKLCEA